MNAKTFVNIIKELFNNCSDFAVRESQTKCGSFFYVLYIINLCEKKYVTESILKPLTLCNTNITKINIPGLLASLPLGECQDTYSAAEKILSGNALIVADENGNFFAYAVDSKNDSGRGISEPESESVIRGPRQGFIESAEANVTMIRKIIKSPFLKVLNYKCGDKTNTNIKIMYYEGIARQEIIDEVIKRIKNVKLDSCIDSGYLEQCIQTSGFQLFSELGNSEKPDKVASKILGGRVAIICDGSPVILTAPYLFTESIQSSEDYLKNIYYATFVRCLRFLGMFISLYLPAIYVAILDFHKGAIPYSLYKIQQQSRNDIPFDVFTELLIILIIFEIIREVGLRMPKAVGDAVGIVGGLILGDAAIKAGIASETVIIISALTAICNFMNPTYMNSSVLIRFLNLILSKMFGFFGIASGFMLILSLLCAKKSFGVPFMSPFAPFNNKAVIDTFILNPKKALSNETNEIKKYGKK